MVFFNIDTDMLLLDVHFFADDFSAAVSGPRFEGDGREGQPDAYTLTGAASGT